MPGCLHSPRPEPHQAATLDNHGMQLQGFVANWLKMCGAGCGFALAHSTVRQASGMSGQNRGQYRAGPGTRQGQGQGAEQLLTNNTLHTSWKRQAAYEQQAAAHSLGI